MCSSQHQNQNILKQNIKLSFKSRKKGRCHCAIYIHEVKSEGHLPYLRENEHLFPCWAQLEGNLWCFVRAKIVRSKEVQSGTQVTNTVERLRRMVELLTVVESMQFLLIDVANQRLRVQFFNKSKIGFLNQKESAVDSSVLWRTMIREILDWSV